MAEQLMVARVGALLRREAQATFIEDIEDIVGLLAIGYSALTRRP